MSNRRESRELVLQALYSKEISDNDIAAIFSEWIKPKLETGEELTFAEKLLYRTIEYREDCDHHIIKQLKNYELHRLALIDKLILRMAIVELLHFEDIPIKVTINEAIDLAKKYSTARSGYFVNGILDAIAKELQEEGLIRKTGRGQIEVTL